MKTFDEINCDPIRQYLTVKHQIEAGLADKKPEISKDGLVHDL